MQQDLDILWQTYRKVHPSYDWYMPADTVDARFRHVRQSLTDSLTEPEFRLRLSYATAAIHCGHTSILPPAALSNLPRSRAAQFPMNMRVWGSDSMIVTDNQSPNRDSVKRGVAIVRINQVPTSKLITQMQQYISQDGLHNAYSEAILSAGFAQRFRWMYGVEPQYQIAYRDSSGNIAAATVKSLAPRPPDSNRQQSSTPRPPRPPQQLPRQNFDPRVGVFYVDSSKHFAYLRLNSFTGKGVNKLIRQSFEKLQQHPVPNLVIDIRDNGGGRIAKAALLARYLVSEPFQLADSVSATSLQFPYPKYVQAHLVYQLFGWLLVHKKSDGRLHFGNLERREYQPIKSDHYNGNVYVLTGGRTFSASIMFLQYIANRPNKWVVGEETGGVARGNSSVITPDLELPNTKIRARLPLFRLVTRQALPQDGRGVVPDIIVPPNSADIRYRKDAVMEKVRRLVGGK